MTNYNKCIAYIGSTTLCMKAQKILSSYAIMSYVVKVSSSKTHKGCGYGLSFDCGQKQNVENILARDGVQIKEML